ncbi:MAG TPA: hypothetical protein VMG38_21300 [Trebonia sp.]|nr:hypothetical protein [Trebonia sp.]
MRTVVFGRMGDPEFDPKFPAAYPVEGRAGLLGEMPVRLRAEGKVLVAYGFGGQRLEIPATSIAQVWIHPEFEAYPGRATRAALLVLDTRHHVLLKAPGAWGPGVREVCQHLGLHRQPVVLDAEPARRKAGHLRNADGYRRLRVRPAGSRVAAAAGRLGGAGLCLGGAIGGASLGLLLPASVGDTRILVAVGLGVVGALSGAWLYNFGTRLAGGLIRWAVASRRAGAPAPAGRFLRVSGASSWTELATSAVLAAAVPALAIWGAAIEAITLTRGGSLSHGPALGNVIAGALALLVAPLLGRLGLRRFLAARHRVRDYFTNLA